AAGTHVLTATATDIAGNVSAHSAALTAVIGTPGNDVLADSPGAVIMLGGAGNDTYIVHNVGDVVTEAVGGGTDTVNASVSYTLAALSEVEIMNGTGGTAGLPGLTLTGN